MGATMKIASSQLSLHSNRHYKETTETQERFQFSVAPSSDTPPTRQDIIQTPLTAQNTFNNSTVNINTSFTQISIRQSISGLLGTKATTPTNPPTENEQKIMKTDLAVLVAILERFFGKKIFLFDTTSFQKQANETEHRNRIMNAETQPAGFSLIYDHYESYHEIEQTSFQATGIIKTTDGKEININYTLNLSREFFNENHTSIRIGEALKDPLVINFDGKSTELTSRNFLFDLDSDGKEDQISFVKSGSGFLAIDKNNDGIINDGSELFGPSSGNGFTELKKYDSDGNQFIDEADPIYEKLRIWIRDDNNPNNPRLIALGDKNIGAIYLGHINNAFSLKDQQNNLLGIIRKSSIYLEDTGKAGAIHHIDIKA